MRNPARGSAEHASIIEPPAHAGRLKEAIVHVRSVGCVDTDSAAGLRIDDQTILVVMSDHGTNLGEHPPVARRR